MASLLINADYNSTSIKVSLPDYFIDSTGSVLCGTDLGPTVLRTILRFPMDDLPSGQAISLAEVRLTQWQNFDTSDRSHYYGPYHVNGLTDPEGDNALTQHTRSDVSSTKYVTTTDHQTDGNKAVAITSGAAAHIAAAAGATYTVVLQQTDETTDATKYFKAYGQDESLTPPDHVPQLYIEYAPAPSADSGAPPFWRWRV